MPTVVLRHPLRDLADGETHVEVGGTSVGEALAALERIHPRLKGWVLDEHGEIRRHVNVFVDGLRASAGNPVPSDGELNIIQAISGGASDQVELLVGTRKGLFVLRGDRGGGVAVAGRVFEGTDVEYAIRDGRTGTYYASITSGHFGPHLYFTEDPLGEWAQADGPAFPGDTGARLVRTWIIQPGEEDGVLWAGTDPAALFKSSDGGRSWELNRGLWDHPTRPGWQPGGGGLALHSIATWPGEPQRMAVGVSAAGVWLTDDGGGSWRRGVGGIVPRYVPEEAPGEAFDLCIHNMHRAPKQPSTLYMQFHGGVYRSDDAGETWDDVGGNESLASDFGFPLVVDPHDPDHVFVVPLASDSDRVTPEGRVRVFESRDRGKAWSPLSEGLPESAYLTILRQAFGHDGRDPLGLYFGATSGDVFGSADGGRSWRTLARYLPPVLSVRVA